jgi:hypothetical protein
VEALNGHRHRAEYCPIWKIVGSHKNLREGASDTLQCPTPGWPRSRKPLFGRFAVSHSLLALKVSEMV